MIDFILELTYPGSKAGLETRRCDGDPTLKGDTLFGGELARFRILATVRCVVVARLNT